jgi:hypothetical protein
VVAAHLERGPVGARAVVDDPADRVERAEQPLPALLEEPRVLLDAGAEPGCMFCIDPAHNAMSRPRQSPKYFQVSESGPRGFGVIGGSPRRVGTDYGCCQARI